MKEELNLNGVPTFKEYYEAYKNNELILERLNNLIDTNSKEHTRIEEQTKRTNGKVADIEKWRWMMVGALTFISIVLLPIIFIMAQKYFQ